MEDMIKEFKDAISLLKWFYNCRYVTISEVFEDKDSDYEYGNYYRLTNSFFSIGTRDILITFIDINRLKLDEVIYKHTARDVVYNLVAIFKPDDQFTFIPKENVKSEDGSERTDMCVLFKNCEYVRFTKSEFNAVYDAIAEMNMSSGDELKETLAAVKNMACKDTAKDVNDVAVVSASNSGTIKLGDPIYIAGETTYTIIKQINNEMEILDVVADYHKALGILMEELFNRGAKENDFRYTAPVNMLNDNGIVIEATSGKGKEAVMNKYYILKYTKKADVSAYSITYSGGSSVIPLSNSETVDPVLTIPCSYTVGSTETVGTAKTIVTNPYDCKD